MRPLLFFSIATANRFIHSCWASLSVAVESFITIVLSCAAAGPDAASTASAAAHRARRVFANVVIAVSSRRIWGRAGRNFATFSQATRALPAADAAPAAGTYRRATAPHY